MTLKEYIEKMSPEKIARNLHLSPGTVNSWRWGVRQPSVYKAIELIIKTDGLLDWDDIYCNEIKRVKKDLKDLTTKLGE